MESSRSPRKPGHEAPRWERSWEVPLGHKIPKCPSGTERLLKRMLPEPYNRQFREFIDVLRIDYFYNGNYPKDRVEEEFDKWYRIVEEFIRSLEHEIEKKQ